MAFLKYAFSLTTLTIFVALFGIILEGFFAAKELQHITHILTHLVNLENTHFNDAPLQAPRIAVGYGSCFDLYIQATKFLNYTHNVSMKYEEYDDDLNKLEELMQSFGYYFQRGAAAE